MKKNLLPIRLGLFAISTFFCGNLYSTSVPIAVSHSTTSGTANVALALSGTTVVPGVQVTGTVAKSGTANYSTTSGTAAMITGTLPAAQISGTVSRSGTADYSTTSGTAAMISGTLPAAQISGTVARSGTANYSTTSGTSAMTTGTLSAAQITGTAAVLSDVATAQAAAISAAATDATTKANAAQAFAIQRANHTGTQAVSTITGTAATLADLALKQDASTALAIGTSGTNALAGNKIGTRTVWTSATCVSDADLSKYSSTFGTNQTSPLQAILNSATSSPLHVMWNGGYSGNRLRIYSNTTIEVLPGCGYILRDSTNEAFLENGNTVLTGTATDHDITIRGGIWNGNGAGQSHDTATYGWTVGFRFIGVSHLTIDSAQILCPRTFSSYAVNCMYENYLNVCVDSGTAGPFNHDGLHFGGANSSVLIKNFIPYTDDDAISLCANDVIQAGCYPMLGSLGTPVGAQTNFVIDGLVLNDSNFGIRLLSTTARIDKIVIKNVLGSTTKQWLLIDNYTDDPSLAVPIGDGNIGSVSVESCDVSLNGAGYKNAHVFLGCAVDSLVINGLRRGDSLISIPTIQLSSSAKIKRLRLENYAFFDEVKTNSLNHLINAGRIQRLEIINPTYAVGGSTTANGNILLNTGTIDTLYRTGLVANQLAGVISNSGTIVNNLVGVADSITTMTTPWTVSNWGYDILNPDAISVTIDTAPKLSTAVRGTDGLGGNATVSARASIAGTLGSSNLLGITLRGTNTVAWGGSTSCYYAALRQDTAALPTVNNIVLRKKISGTETDLATIAVPLALVDYDIFLKASGTTISSYVRRVSDSLWLQSNGTWNSTSNAWASVTDTGIAAANGEVGALGYGAQTHSQVYSLTQFNVGPP